MGLARTRCVVNPCGGCLGGRSGGNCGAEGGLGRARYDRLFFFVVFFVFFSFFSSSFRRESPPYLLLADDPPGFSTDGNADPEIFPWLRKVYLELVSPPGGASW
jgi:hypothetical protein